MVEKHERPDQLRVMHADRQRAVERLGVAMTAGCLTMSEFEERVAAAWAAKVRMDLDALMTDLPPELAVIEARGGKRAAAERMLPVLRGASATWLVLSTISLMLWGLAWVMGGVHVAVPWFLLLFGGGGALLAPAWHVADTWRGRRGP